MMSNLDMALEYLKMEWKEEAYQELCKEVEELRNNRNYLRVKIFSSFTEEALEMKINDYLALNKCKVLDVKYQVVAVDSQIFNYAILIIEKEE